MFVPLSQRTRLAKSVEKERRRSSTQTHTSSLRDPIQVSTLEYDLQKWIVEMKSKGTYVFNLSKFNFMQVGTEMVGENIKDTPTSEPWGED